MSFFSDLKVLYHMAVSPIRGATHAERLESFYAGQAEAYDDFRRRLLTGRKELVGWLPVREGDVWVDIGGGTGSNLELLGDDIARLKSVHVVDLSPSLLDVARRRAAARGWSNVHAVEADALAFTPPEGQADVVLFSYSLTMIPDWFAALFRAYDALRPGGLIGVVDFTVSRKYPAPGRARQGGFRRGFWPLWFARDNVFLSPDHAPFLHWLFEPVRFAERDAKVPYIPFLRVPTYRFVGRKPEA